MAEKTASQVDTLDLMVFDDAGETYSEEVAFTARSTSGAVLIWTDTCDVTEPMSFDPSAFVQVDGDA